MKNLRILKRAIVAQRATVVKMRKRHVNNERRKENCRKFLARFLSRFNQEEIEEEDPDGIVPDKDFNKIKSLLREDRIWSDLK